LWQYSKEGWLTLRMQFGPRAEGSLVESPIERTMERLRHEIPELDEEAAEAHIVLSRAYGVYFAALAARYESLGLSVPRFNTLRWLYHADSGHLTISELSAHLEASLPTVMRMVHVLEEDGWIRRWDSETDRRVTLVELTVEGREGFSSVLKEAAEVWREIWSGLDVDEKNTLSRILSRLRANLLARYIGRVSLLPYKLDKMQAQADGRGYSPRTPE
jgi:MarR family transcriptional regulator, 2-MHQ and catechol-resistance regulon repressor